MNRPTTTITTCSAKGSVENVWVASLKKPLTCEPRSTLAGCPATGFEPPLPETWPAGPWLMPLPYSTRAA